MWLVPLALACGAEPPRERVAAPAPADAAPSPPAPAVSAPEPETTPAPTAAVADVPAPPPAVARAARKRAPAAAPIEAIPDVPLEKLLEVPPWAMHAPAEPDINEVLRLELPPEPVVAPLDEATGVRVLHLDVDARTDAPIERRDWKRDQVDAGAKVDISKDTSIRGGVRIERETSGTKEPVIGTTPSIGIEKRF